MPPRRSINPASLEDLCLWQIIHFLKTELEVCHHVRTYQNKSLLLRQQGINAKGLIAQLNSYFDILPPLLNEIVRQNIINIVLKDAEMYNLVDSFVMEYFELLLNKDVKRLEFSGSSFPGNSDIWSLIQRRCTQLDKFILAPNMFKRGPLLHQSFFVWLGRNNATLTELVLKDGINSAEPLAVIGKYCHRLRKLDICGSLVRCTDLMVMCVRATSPGSPAIVPIPSLVGQDVLNPLCQSLQVLLLDDTSVKFRGVAFVLKVMPNLTSLGNITCIASALKKLHGAKLITPPGLHLQHASFHKPTNVKLKILANSCPALETLILGVDDLSRVDFHNLPSFRNLRSLTIQNIHFEDVVVGLCSMPNLTELQISCEDVDVMVIGLCCLKLKKLVLEKEPLKVLTLPKDDVPIFAELEQLKITHTISAECAGFFFTRASKLRDVRIIKIKDLTEHRFTSWIRKNPLLHLETFLVRYAHLTRLTVDLLLDQCPRLTRLGELGGWDIRSWECRRLKDLVVSENYALHLTFFQRQSQSDTVDLWSSDDDAEI